MRQVLIFILTAAILVLSLIAVATIPTENIRDNLETSADYLSSDKQNWRYVLDGVDASQLDLYADSMLLDIACYMDSGHPLQSVMWARYYWGQGLKINASLLKAVTENPEPNKEYVRYWHGSLVFVRPLLLIMDLQGIYVLHAVILALLLAFILFLLIRNNLKAEAISLCIAMVAVNAVFVPFCLEYYWMFLLMFIASILAVRFSLADRYDRLPALFLIIGIVAAFLDFFTTETLTITVPLLLSLRIRERQRHEEGSLKFIIKCMLLWGIGYVGMWVLKWILASVVIGENAMQYVQGSIGEHLGMDDRYPAYLILLDAILRNIWALFPFGYGMAGGAVFVGLLGVVVLLILKNRIVVRETVNGSWVKIYALIGVVPYIRYLAIRHHSWFHYFFTHRAQAATVMALCFIAMECLKWEKRKCLTSPS